MRPTRKSYDAAGAVLVLLLAGAAVAAAQPASVDGHWKGRIEVPGNPLEIDVDLVTGEGGDLAGDISIPVQGLRDLGLVDLAREGDEVRFRIPGIPGEPTFAGTLGKDGDRIEGRFRQGGAELDFVLVRGDSPAAAARAALDGFDAFAARAVEDWQVPGGGLAVVAGGEVVFAEAFGFRDLENRLPMTPDTLFAIGSTTKAFTTTVLGMLVDDGDLDWDAPLREVLPRFRLRDPTASELLTARDLVTHRTGLPRHDLLWYNDNDGTRAELVERLAHLEPSAALRARFQYNNLMFLTAGYLTEVLTGGTWEEAVRSRLLEPLAMTRTNFSVEDSQEDPDHALPYRRDEDGELARIPFRPLDLMGPAGSLNSSVREMTRWLLFNLAGGQIDGRRLIQAATLADVHAPHMVTASPPERADISQAAYGLGWMIDTYRGHRRIHHGGGIDGFTTSVMLFPDDGFGLVAFTNRGAGLAPVLVLHAADRLLGLDPVDWSEEGLEDVRAAREALERGEERKTARRRPGTSPSHDLDEYAGPYEHPGYGELSVRRDGDRLAMTFNGITAPLEHWHYDVWVGAETDGDPTFEDLRFQFRSDLDGNVTTVEAPFEISVAPIVFRKKADPRLFDPEYLRRFTGIYDFVNQQITVELSAGVLTVQVPGQPRYTLAPKLSEFVLAEFESIAVSFAAGDDGAVTMTFYQPGGVFEGKRVD